MIMEDDAGPDLHYMRFYKEYMDELTHVPEWELLYLARNKVYESDEEPDVENTLHWVWPQFNTWALNYIITDTGRLISLYSLHTQQAIFLELYYNLQF